MKPVAPHAEHCPTCSCETCDVCGETADSWEIAVMHRGCRLGAAFPEATTTDETGLMTIPIDKLPFTLPKIKTDCATCGGTHHHQCDRCNSMGICHDCCDQALAQQRAHYARQ